MSNAFIRSCVVALVLSASFGRPVLSENSVSSGPSDLECLTVSIHMGASADRHLQETWGLGTLYFLGRLDAKNVSVNAQVLKARILQMTPNRFGEVEGKCAAILSSRGGVLSQIGDELQHH
jgi:hypothetical protein